MSRSNHATAFLVAVSFLGVAVVGWAASPLTLPPGANDAARQIDSLNLWLDDDPQIVELVKRLPQIRRETILNSTKYCPKEASHAARKL